jgi:amino acid adenylation domain-containing protein
MEILEQLDQTCQHFKEHIAIQWNDKQVTYAVLDNKANRLANCLIASQLPKGSIVAVILDDRINIIITLIGILRAGCVFVPLDPEFPEERLRHIVTELSPDCFITQTKFNRLVAHISNHNKKSRLLNIEGNNASEKAHLVPIIEPLNYFSAEKPTVSVDNEAMCYIYYTSGSTGVSKGIAGRLKSISHFIRWEIETFNVVSGWRVSQFTMPTFDAFLRDVFVPLGVGGTICIPPERNELLDSKTLIDWIDNQQINLIHCVPSLFRIMVNGDLDSHKLPSLKYILMAGEVLHVSEVKKWLETYTNKIKLVNLYGPSETTMVKFCHLVQESDLKRGFIPIGKSIKGAKALILDDEKEVCPLGIKGELYLRTPYMTLGYYNNPELTQEVFIKNPFTENPSDLIYKTGDLARVLSDGNFQLIGRKDNQVKIRGIRIELGEIENILINHQFINEAVVLFREDIPDNQRLVAYTVPALEQYPTTSELQSFLKERLPGYMVPSIFVMLEAMPLTNNSKIDRHALPIPEQTRQAPEETFVAPRNKLEFQLAKIWQKVLGIQSIGIHDNFFDLGGHSLLAVTLLSRIEKMFDKHLHLMRFYQAPTIAQLANLLRDKNDTVSWNVLEVVRPQNGTCPPFFMMGPSRLAKALLSVLEPEQPIYGLNVLTLQPSDSTTPLTDIKKLAKRCIQEIQTVQPEGPYYLSGYCIDAPVAFEIAQQLYADGKKVALLALFDAFLNKIPQWEHGYSLNHHWLNWLEMGLSYPLQKIRTKWQRFLRKRELKLFGQSPEKLKKTQKALPSQLQYTLFLNAYREAAANYVPQIYPGHITFFFASEWRLKDSSAFAQSATGNVEIYQIRGYHESLFVSPQLEEMGKLLRRCLEEANKK